MIRTILHYPDKRLRERGKKVDAITPELTQLIDDMAETMYAAPGVGLAATQIGELIQLFIIDIASEDEPSELRVFINPEILERDGQQTLQEGCLSFPGVHEEIKRAARVKARALGRDGQPFELEAEGLLGAAIQHEIDHLDGILFLDHLSLIKRQMLLARWRRERKDETGYLREVVAETARPE